MKMSKDNLSLNNAAQCPQQLITSQFRFTLFWLKVQVYVIVIVLLISWKEVSGVVLSGK